MKIRKMESSDITSSSIVHRESFIRQKLSMEWITCLYNSFPRSMCYVAEIEEAIAGYIIWTQKSGFRNEVVLELEQIAVHPEYRNKGIARNLIQVSLSLVKGELSKMASSL